MPAGRPEALTFPMIASHAVDRGRKTGAGALVLSRTGGRTRNLVGRDLRQQINQLVRGAGVHGGKNKFSLVHRESVTGVAWMRGCKKKPKT